MSELLLQALASGLALGLIYAGLGAGFSLMVATGRLYNLAHGEFVLIGGYVLYVLGLVLGWPWAGALAASALGGAVLGLALPPVVRRLPHPEVNGLALTLGLAFALQNLLLLSVSATYRILPGGWWFETFALGPVGVSRATVVGGLAAVATLLAFDLWLRFTWTGSGLRAASQSPAAAASVGISPARMQSVAFMVAGAIAASAGGLVLLTRFLAPSEGPAWTLVALAVALLARRPQAGALIGAGIGLGLIESMATALLGGGWREVMSGAFVLLWLLVRREHLLAHA